MNANSNEISPEHEKEEDDGEDSENSDAQKVQDEYTIMLIRKELEVMMSEISVKMDGLTRIVTDTRRLQDLEARVDENEQYAKENIQINKKDIFAIFAKMKIQ